MFANLDTFQSIMQWSGIFIIEEPKVIELMFSIKFPTEIDYIKLAEYADKIDKML